jgi:phosphomevalonate kinase
MISVEASAPGKAVLCGEYAVLDGAPAISMAIDRRARVTIEETNSQFHSVAAPGLHEGVVAFRANGDGSIEWLEAGSGFALLEEVWRCVRPVRPQGLAITLDTRPFFDGAGGRKLGFGSSAALAVALAAALTDGDMHAGDLHGTAAAAHRSFQHGRGSGVDVATAVHGGVLAYWMEPARVAKLDWPAGLHFELLWSRQPASTADRLARLARAGRGASAGDLGETAAHVLDAWQRGAARAVLDALREYVDALQRFNEQHGLGVFDAGHREVLADAGPGVVYKPCGAGGGDIGIVLAEERAAVSEFAERARLHGFVPLQVRCDLRGVQRDGSSGR